MAIIEAIETIRLEATAASVSFDSMAGYEHLQLRFSAATDDTGGNWKSINLQFNNDTASNYTYRQMYSYSSSTATFGSNAANTRSGWITTYEGGIGGGAGNYGGGAPQSFGGGVITIPDYLNTNKNTASFTMGGTGGRGATRGLQGVTWGLWDTTSALTKITLAPQTGSWITGTTFTLYGIKSS